MALFGGLLDPPAANVPVPQMQNYAPTGMAGSEQNLLGGISNLGGWNTYGQNLPWATNIGQSMINDPNAGAYIGGAGQAGGMGMGAATNQFNQGGGLYGLGGRIANTAFDPQSALYARTLQQLQDQTRAGQAARGIQTTPYGAGLEDQQTRNFNIDWQNQQLQRQIQGGQAAGGLYNQAAGMQAGAAPLFMQSSMYPWQAGQQVGQANLGTLGQLGGMGQQASTIPQRQIADWQNYMGWGNQANANANTANNQLFQNQLNQANQGFNQQQTMFNNIGRLAGTAFGVGMGGGGGGFGMGSFGGG